MVKKAFVGAVFKTESYYFNRDDCQTLFDHCLLHLIRLSELGVKSNPKPAFKT